MPHPSSRRIRTPVASVSPNHNSPSSKTSNSTRDVFVLPRKWAYGIAVFLVVYTFGLTGWHFGQVDLLFRTGDSSLLAIWDGYGTNAMEVTTPTTIQKDRVPEKSSTPFPSHLLKSLQNTHSKIVFYHIYIPPSPAATTTAATAATTATASTLTPPQQHALDIVQEQLSQLAHQNVTVLYNTIGASHVLKESIMTNYCRAAQLTCYKLHHFEHGMEDATLQHVYEYCSSSSHAQKQKQPQSPNQSPKIQRIGYMHNKGSHHPSTFNNRWRFLITHAMMRDECWSSSSTTTPNNEEEGCNLCGLYLTTDRGLYMAGNVWTSTCGYISKLLEPRFFERELEKVAGAALLKHARNEVTMTQYPIQTSYLGLGRYASEWWIGSHPSLRPCDFSASVAAGSDGSGFDRTKDFLNFVNRDHTGGGGNKKNMTDAMAQQILRAFTPRAPFQDYKLPKAQALQRLQRQQQSAGQEGEAYRRDYFLLAGILYRQLQLYHAVPSQESWMWRHYPEGDWWKQAVQQYGTEVLEKGVNLSQPISTLDG